MTLRVICDTNVLISALIADGPPSRLLEEAIEGRITLLLPRFVLAELERVLLVKFEYATERVDAARALFAQIAAEEPSPAQVVEAISGDPADDVILACAVDASADVLATGDRKHLLPLGSHRGVRVVTPQSLLAELRGLR